MTLRKMNALFILRKVLKNRNWKVRLLQLFNHFVVITYFSLRGFHLEASVSIFFYFLFFCVGINIGAHRLFSHRSFKTSPILEAFIGYCTCLASVGSPMAWANMHRKHHIFSDQRQDPHSPIKNGRLTIIGLLGAYFGIWSEFKATSRYNAGMSRDPLQRFFHYYYFGSIGLYALVAFLIAGWDGVVIAYCIPAVMCFHAASLIVTLGHSSKYNHHTKDYTHDSFILHILTWGEGLHQSHHRWPKKKYYERTGLFVDLPGLIIKYFFENRSIR